MRRSVLLLVLLTTIVLLAGCGQKGPLVRPGGAPAPAHSAPQAPSSDLPTPIPDDGGR